MTDSNITSHPNVTAIVWAGLGGTETGNALVDVIGVRISPNCYSFEKTLEKTVLGPIVAEETHGPSSSFGQ